MPDIRGTNGDDDIDVTDDDGTLNGVPQGTPIDRIRGRRGDDSVTVTNSTIAGNVTGGSGNDDMAVTGSTISGVLSGGSSDDTLRVEDSDIRSIRLGSGSDTLDFVNSSVSGNIDGGSGTDSLNLAVGSEVNDAIFGTFTVTLGGVYNLSRGSFTLPSGSVVTYSDFEDGTGVPCFTKGTLINTDAGVIRVQDLQVGDRLPTGANGLQTIRWIGHRRISAKDLENNPNLRPVRIVSGALGNGLPARDLLVSRQHRMLVSSKIAERMFGTSDVLVSAIKLTGLPGIYLDQEIGKVEYYHLLLDQHEVIYAEGAPTESLYIGPETLRAVPPASRLEILAIFPELADRGHAPEPARPLPSNRRQQRLIARHVRNHKPPLQLLDHEDLASAPVH